MGHAIACSPKLWSQRALMYMFTCASQVARWWCCRYGDRNRYLKQDVLQHYGNMSMDDCLRQPVEMRGSCFNCPPAAQTLAFCGRDGGDCESLPEAAQLRRALVNIQAHYFVGVTEHFVETMGMLELLFPDFFRGVGALLAESKPQKVTRNREEYVEPSAEARGAAAEWAHVDMQLYDRVTKHFWVMHDRCMGAA